MTVSYKKHIINNSNNYVSIAKMKLILNPFNSILSVQIQLAKSKTLTMLLINAACAKFTI